MSKIPSFTPCARVPPRSCCFKRSVRPGPRVHRVRTGLLLRAVVPRPDRPICSGQSVRGEHTSLYMFAASPPLPSLFLPVVLLTSLSSSPQVRLFLGRSAPFSLFRRTLLKSLDACFLLSAHRADSGFPCFLCVPPSVLHFFFRVLPSLSKVLSFLSAYSLFGFVLTVSVIDLRRFSCAVAYLLGGLHVLVAASPVTPSLPEQNTIIFPIQGVSFPSYCFLLAPRGFDFAHSYALFLLCRF